MAIFLSIPSYSWAQDVAQERDGLNLLLEEMPSCATQQLRYTINELQRMEARGDFDDNESHEYPKADLSETDGAESEPMDGNNRDSI